MNALSDRVKGQRRKGFRQMTKTLQMQYYKDPNKRVALCYLHYVNFKKMLFGTNIVVNKNADFLFHCNRKLYQIYRENSKN